MHINRNFNKIDLIKNLEKEEFINKFTHEYMPWEIIHLIDRENYEECEFLLKYKANKKCSDKNIFISNIPINDINGIECRKKLSFESSEQFKFIFIDLNFESVEKILDYSKICEKIVIFSSSFDIYNTLIEKSREDIIFIYNFKIRDKINFIKNANIPPVKRKVLDIESLKSLKSLDPYEIYSELFYENNKDDIFIFKNLLKDRAKKAGMDFRNNFLLNKLNASIPSIDKYFIKEYGKNNLIMLILFYLFKYQKEKDINLINNIDNFEKALISINYNHKISLDILIFKKELWSYFDAESELENTNDISFYYHLNSLEYIVENIYFNNLEFNLIEKKAKSFLCYNSLKYKCKMFSDTHILKNITYLFGASEDNYNFIIQNDDSILGLFNCLLYPTDKDIRCERFYKSYINYLKSLKDRKEMISNIPLIYILNQRNNSLFLNELLNKYKFKLKEFHEGSIIHDSLSTELSASIVLYFAHTNKYKLLIRLVESHIFEKGLKYNIINKYTDDLIRIYK
jgi:hypothetical protein